MKNTVIIAMMVASLGIARAEDKRQVPAHAHMGMDGFISCDTGYVSYDQRNCVAYRLSDPGEVTIELNDQHGGRFREYIPADGGCAAGYVPSQDGRRCVPPRLTHPREVDDRGGNFKEYAPPER